MRGSRDQGSARSRFGLLYPPRQRLSIRSRRRVVADCRRTIHPYTPRHKVERSHREDRKRFYSVHSFFSLAGFEKQLAVHNCRSNNLPMRPLHWFSPFEFFSNLFDKLTVNAYCWDHRLNHKIAINFIPYAADTAPDATPVPLCNHAVPCM